MGSPPARVWFFREKAGGVPYRPCALSNFGSIFGLVPWDRWLQQHLRHPEI